MTSTHRLRTGLIALVLAETLAGCSTPTTPSAPPAQANTVTGVVSTGGINIPFGVPMQGIRVRVDQGLNSAETTTDQNGGYTVAGLQPGSSTVTASEEGSVSYSGSLTISGAMRLDIRIMPRAIYTLSGVVSERTPTGLVPVEGVTVTEGYKDQLSLTDSTGAYRITELFRMPFHPAFSKDGYLTESRVVTINGDTRLDVQLTRR